MPLEVQVVLGPVAMVLEDCLTQHPMYVCKHKTIRHRDRDIGEFYASWPDVCGVDFDMLDQSVQLPLLRPEQEYLREVADWYNCSLSVEAAMGAANNVRIAHVDGWVVCRDRKSVV